MKINISVVIVFISILFVCFVYAQDESAQPFESEREQEAIKKRTEQIEKMSKDSDSHIKFYGLVKDQYGDPVAGARVVVTYRHFDLFSPYFTKHSKAVANTDSQGRFVFEDLNGRSLYVKKIEKEGYIYDFRKNRNRYFNYDAKRSDIFTPDKQNFIVFICDKKPKPGFVIEKIKSYIGKASGETLQVDIYEGFLRSSRTRKGRWGDIRIEIRPSANAGDHTVKIKLNNQDDGLLVKEPVDNLDASDQDGSLLVEDLGESHVASDDGCIKSVEFTIKQYERVAKDIYYKGQKETGAVYARVYLKLSAGNTSVRLDCKLYTNLEGGKNLNYDRKYTLNRKIQDVSAKIDKEPKNVMLYKERAELKERLFLYDDAIFDISKAIKIDPENKGLQRVKEDLQWGKEKMAERKARGFKFPD